MRALLLLLVGAGILWGLMQGFGGGLRDEPPTVEAGGILLPEPTDPAAVDSKPAPASSGTQGEQILPQRPDGLAAASLPERAPSVGVEEGARIASSPTTRPFADPSAEAVWAADRLLGSELLHRTAGLPDWCLAHASEIPAPRSLLARVLALRVLGRMPDAEVALAELGRTPGLTETEQAFLTGWMAAPAPLSTTSAETSPLLLGASLAARESRGKSAMSASRWAAAASEYSRLLVAECTAPWDAEVSSLRTWTEALNKAQRGHQWSKSGTWEALEIRVEPGDSLISIRKRALKTVPDLLTCTGLIARANQLASDVVQPGQVLRVPTSKPEVFVYLRARWLLFVLGDEVVGAWPVGVGKPGSETPVGAYRVGEKSTEPTWFRAGQAPVPAGDDRNPLGTRWMAWIRPDGSKTHLGFHGTRDPESIGIDESEGCVRMLNRHAEELYEVLPRGTTITVLP